MKEDLLFSAVNMMIKTNHMHKHLIDNIVRNIGIHRTHHIILMHLARHGRLLSQKQLSEHLGITQAAVTQALKKLEADGYIKRELGDDNRYNEITITTRGIDVVEYTKTAFSAIDRSLFDGFSSDELENYVGFLEKIQKNILNKMEGGEVDEKMV